MARHALPFAPQGRDIVAQGKRSAQPIAPPWVEVSFDWSPNGARQ